MSLASILSDLLPEPGGDLFPKDGDVCGGSTSYHDSKAPKEITCEDIDYFEVECSFVSLADQPPYSYIYGYAAKVDAGVLAALICSNEFSFAKGSENRSAVAIVSPEVLGELQRVVAKYEFAKHNGASHYVNGLPQDFGGSVRIDYASGEYIRFNDNQCPVIDAQAGVEIADILTRFIEQRRCATPDPAGIVAVTYHETRGEDNFSHYRMEGSTLISKMQFGKGDTLYEHEFAVNESAMEEVRVMVAKSALLGWTGLRERGHKVIEDRVEQVIFTMDDGREIVVDDNMEGPRPASRAVFDIQMYLRDLMN